MTDPRKSEADAVIAFAKAHGADGLVESLFFSDKAIRYVLSTKTRESKKLRQSLIDIINGDDPLAKLHQQSVDAQIDSIPLTGGEGFLPMAAKFNANTGHQIAAIKYLTSFIETDDAVYEALWQAANGKKSHITNVGDAAIVALARGNPKRKQDLRKIATDPQIDQYVRWNALTILAFYDLTKDKSIYDLVCNVADDNSISHLFIQKGEMSPNAKFWCASDLKRRKDFPEQHNDGKNDEQVREDVVKRVQDEFREGIFDVIGYIIEHRYSTDLHNSFIYPFMDDRDAGKFERFDSSRLTTQLCNLLQRRPSHHVQVLCRYSKLPIPKEQVQQIQAVLTALKHNTLIYSSESGCIDGTLNDIDYMLKKKYQ